MIDVKSIWLALCALLCCVPVLADAGPLRLAIFPAPPIYSGTEWSFGLSFTKSEADGQVNPGPFTLRTTLPPGVEYLGASGSNWQCVNTPTGSSSIACMWSGTLTPANGSSSSVRIETRVDPAVVPGPFTLQVTIESAQIPLPSPLPCAPSPSDTGCATASLAIATSSLTVADWGFGIVAIDQTGPVATVTQPFEAGAIGVIVVRMDNVGYGESNTPVRAILHLPAGLSFRNYVNGLPQWSCTAVPGAPAGQVLTCVTPYLIGPSSLSIAVDVAPDITVPGPAQVFARLENDVQQVALATCMADPASPGCGRLTIPTRPPRLPELAVDTLVHSPTRFRRGQEGFLQLGYLNSGEGAAPATRVLMQLPAGFVWNRAINASPPLACTASGDPALGQTVSCTGNGLPASSEGNVLFVVDVDYSAPAPAELPVVIALDHASTPTSGLLESCATDPGQLFCGWIEIPVQFVCADQYGADGVYCDGFEAELR